MYVAKEGINAQISVPENAWDSFMTLTQKYPFMKKAQIKKAIQEKYSVTVEKVRTQIYGPERSTKYTKKGIQNTKSKIIKKAIVQLAEGDTIDFYSNL